MSNLPKPYDCSSQFCSIVSFICFASVWFQLYVTFRSIGLGLAGSGLLDSTGFNMIRDLFSMYLISISCIRFIPFRFNRPNIPFIQSTPHLHLTSFQSSHTSIHRSRSIHSTKVRIRFAFHHPIPIPPPPRRHFTHGVLLIVVNWIIQYYYSLAFCKHGRSDLVGALVWFSHLS